MQEQPAYVAFATYIPRVFELALQQGMTYDRRSGILYQGGHTCIITQGGKNCIVSRSVGDAPPILGLKRMCEDTVQRQRTSRLDVSGEDRSIPESRHRYMGTGVWMDVGEFFAGFFGPPPEACLTTLLATGVLLRHISKEQITRVLRESEDTMAFDQFLLLAQRSIRIT